MCIRDSAGPHQVALDPVGVHEKFVGPGRLAVGVQQEPDRVVALVLVALAHRRAQRRRVVVADEGARPRRDLEASCGGQARIACATARGRSGRVLSRRGGWRRRSPRALHTPPDGPRCAGTAPSGKAYRVRPGRADKALGATPFFDPQETYIWALARGADGALWVATGTEGHLYRVDAAGQGTLAYDGEDAHLRSLLVERDGSLLIGTAGQGLLLRRSADGSVRTIYDSALSEAVALAETWPAGGPPVLWSLQLGDGHAGPAVRHGRVYILDYDEKARADGGGRLHGAST